MSAMSFFSSVKTQSGLAWCRNRKTINAYGWSNHRVGRTLLSAAFDLAVDFDLGVLWSGYHVGPIAGRCVD